MKPQKVCPGCKAYLENNQLNSIWFEQRCSNACSLNYRQYFNSSFQEDHLKYLVFHTKNFFIYYYIEDKMWPNSIHAYYHDFKNKNTQPPALKIPAESIKIDFNDLDKLDHKLKIWALFS